MSNIMKPVVFTREQAIQMNREKAKDVILGVSSRGRVKQNEVGFISQWVKSSNTYTFLRLYPDDIAGVLLQVEKEKTLKKQIELYKQSVLKWSLAIDNRIRKSTNPFRRKVKEVETVFSPIHR